MTKRAVVTVALLAMCGAAGLAVACTDSNLSPTKATLAVGPRAGFSRIPSRAPVTPAEFDRRNPMHWVGVAHNRGVDFLRAQLRAHKLHVRDVCRDVPELVARDEARLVGQRRHSAAELARATRAYLEANGSCPRSAAALAPMASVILARPASLLGAGAALDGEAVADGLLDGIGTVTQNASDASSLAPQLDSITALADNLDSVSKSVVYGAAGIAMSSMEYWEDNLVSVTNEVDRDYCENEAPDPNAEACLEIPYSLVAPIALPMMMQHTDWSILGKIAWADAKIVIGGGVAGWLAKAIDWEVTLSVAMGASYVEAVRQLVKALILLL